MKRYRVELDPEAEEEGMAATEYIARSAPLNAARWFAGLTKALDSLQFMPHRFGIAPESRYFGVDLRHLIYKSYRIIFYVDEKARVVWVWHIRHGARRAIGEDEAQ